MLPGFLGRVPPSQPGPAREQGTCRRISTCLTQNLFPSLSLHLYIRDCLVLSSNSTVDFDLVTLTSSLFILPFIIQAQLKRSVEEEYRKWKTMSNENDIVAHFSQSPQSAGGQAGGGSASPHLFICLLWKMLLENDRISPLAYKILDRLGARALSLHLRTFADFLVYEVSRPGTFEDFVLNWIGNIAGIGLTVGFRSYLSKISMCGQDQMMTINKGIDAVNDLIWKCYVLALDRLILTLALRPFEGNEQVGKDARNFL